MKRVTLLGYPNAGKTSIFNALTNKKNKTANFAGVTVDASYAELEISNEKLQIVDLPGINSLTSFSESKDELVVSKYTSENQNDLYLNITEIGQLQKHLLLTATAISKNIKIILVVNMIDTATMNNIEILELENKLSLQLGIPVVCVSAKTKYGIDKLKNLINKNLNNYENKSTIVKFSDNIIDNSKIVKNIYKSLGEINIVSNKLTYYLDKIFLNKFLSIPIFFLVMYFVLFITLNAHVLLSDLIDGIGGAIFVTGVQNLLSYLHLPAIVSLVIAEGIGSGVQTMLTFLPIIFTLFILLAFLEESGYMARQAFLADGVMQKIGLPGKAFISLIVGMGCTGACASGCRTLERESDRRLSLMISPSISCSAKLPVYVFLSALCFPNYSLPIVFLLYFLGIVFAIINGIFLSKSLFVSNPLPFIMEIPNYKIPRFVTICRSANKKTMNFLIRLGKTIVPMIMLLTVLNNITPSFDIIEDSNESSNSILARSSKFITPILSPIGIDNDNWEATLSLITGLLAKETVVATLNAVYFSEEEEKEEGGILDGIVSAFKGFKENVIDHHYAAFFDVDTSEESLGENVQKKQNIIYEKFKTGSAIFAFLLFILIYVPCVSAMGAIAREIGVKWAYIIAFWSVFNAYAIATMFYQISNDLSKGILISTIFIFVYIGIFFIFRYLNKKYISAWASNFILTTTTKF